MENDTKIFTKVLYEKWTCLNYWSFQTSLFVFVKFWHDFCDGFVMFLKVYLIDPQRAFIVLGFKTLDTTFSEVLEATWRDWTGARAIYLRLHNQFDLSKYVLWMWAKVAWSRHILHCQACKLKFRLRDLTFFLCSAAAPAVCSRGRAAGVDATETGNEFSQLKS